MYMYVHIKDLLIFYTTWDGSEKGSVRSFLFMHCNFLLNTGLLAGSIDATVEHTCADFPHIPTTPTTNKIFKLCSRWKLH